MVEATPMHSTTRNLHPAQSRPFMTVRPAGASIYNLQPVEAANVVASDDVTVGEGAEAVNWGVDLETRDFPRDLGAACDVPQPDRAVPRARGEAAVRQKRQRRHAG
jgi:hypothetical protein